MSNWPVHRELAGQTKVLSGLSIEARCYEPQELKACRACRATLGACAAKSAGL